MIHIQKFFGKVKKQPLVLILGGILLAQIFLISICNLKLIDNNIDCDNAKLFVHVMKMWEHKTLMIPDWSYTTTLEWDCSSLFALPIYAITKDIYLSFGIANIIFLCIFIGVLFYLFKDKSAVYPLLAANMVCVPYGVGMLDYFNMMFFCGSQYVLKVLIPLMFIAVLVHEDGEKKHKLSESLFAGAFLLLLFVTSSSSGIYVFMVGIVPIIIVYFLYKLLKCEKISLYIYIMIGIAAVLAVLGIYINNAVMGGARGNSSMVLISIYQVLANVSACLAGLFELFGGAAYKMDMPILSVEGIAVVAKICVVLLLLICAIVALHKVTKNKGDLRFALLLSVFVWNMFVLLTTNARAGSATYEYRYHLIGMIPLICVASVVLLDAFGGLQPVQKNVFGIFGITALVVLNILTFPIALNREDKQVGLKELCAYCEEMDVERVYLYDASNDADMCRLIGDGDVLWLCVISSGETWAYDYYEQYVAAPIVPDNAIMVVENTQYDFGDDFEAFGFNFPDLLL